MFPALRQFGVDIAADGEMLAFAKCEAWCPQASLGDDLRDNPAFIADTRAGFPLHARTRTTGSS